MRKYRKRALDILQKNITTEEAPALLLQWVETGDQNLLLSYEEEGQLLVEIAEALEEAAGEEHALLEALRAEAAIMRRRLRRADRDSTGDEMTWKWMAGMRYMRPRNSHYRRVGDYELIEHGYSMPEDCVPDWEDPATKGCLLDQVRWRHGAECWAEYRTGRGWRVVRPVGEEATIVVTQWHRTEAEALLAALGDAK